MNFTTSTIQNLRLDDYQSLTVTTNQIAKLMKVSERTVHRWRRTDPTFPKAIALPETNAARFDLEMIRRWLDEEENYQENIGGFLRYKTLTLTITEICIALNISKKTFHSRLREDKSFPKPKHVKNSNIVRYKTQEIHQWYLSIQFYH